MVDTIVLKIHDLKKHKSLLNLLSTISSDKFYKQRKPYNTVAVPQSAIEDGVLIDNLVVDEDSFTLVNVETGEVASELVKANPVISLNVYDKKTWRSGMRGKLNAPSHHYSIDFYVNEGQDFVSIDFSVPKYLYSTNVFQFVTHFNQSKFNFTQNKRFDHNVNESYGRLMKLIRIFFARMFKGCNIDLCDVEMSRIDLCYNQVFETESEAREYLQHLQEINKKNIRENSKVRINPQNGNVMFVSANWSAKIYHKGDDFDKHDKRQLIKKEVETGSQIADTNLIQKFANRILRYEITARKGLLQYLFFRDIFRKDCSTHKMEKKIFNKIRRKIELNKLSDKQLLKRAARTKRYQDKDILKRIKILRKEVTPTGAEKKFYRDFTRTTNQSLKFMLEVEIDNPYFRVHHDHHISGGTRTHFSSHLFKLLCRRLIEFAQEFKLENKVSHIEISKRITALNSSIDKLRELPYKPHIEKNDPRNGAKIKSNSHMSAIVMLMDSTGKTFDEVCRVLRIPKTTKYNIKAKFKRLGFSDKAVLPMTIEVSHDFKKYHNWTSANMAKCLPFLFG